MISFSSISQATSQTSAKQKQRVKVSKPSVPERFSRPRVLNKRTIRRRELVLSKKPIIAVLQKLELLDLLRFFKQNEFWDNGFSHFGNDDGNFEH